MNNKQILNLINENKIEELKQAIIAEINKKESGNAYKALLKLSKQAEKEQRRDKLPNGKHSYIRPNIAGAYFKDNQTMICSGYWGIVVNDHIDGLVEAPEKEMPIDMNNFITELHVGIPAEIDMTELTEKAKSKEKIEKNQLAKTVRINGELYNAEYVYDVLQVFENDYKMYTFGTHKLQIENDTKKAIVMGILERR